MPAEEVISCPACRHLLRVPADWLGTEVQCPECRSMFRAPVRDGDRLTDAVLLSRTAAAEAAAPPRRRSDLMLSLPAFGLLIVGVAGVLVNGFTAARSVLDPDGVKAAVRAQVVDKLRQHGSFDADPPGADVREQLDDERAAQAVEMFQVVTGAFAVVSAGEFVGGLALVRGRGYWLAVLGCVLAIVNFPNLCCVPGAVFGVWGLVLLFTPEGRAHFGMVRGERPA